MTERPKRRTLMDIMLDSIQAQRRWTQKEIDAAKERARLMHEQLWGENDG